MELLKDYPEFVAQLHPFLNEKKKGRRDFLLLSVHSTGVKLWWLGECGHEWEASPKSRVVNQQGCPFCAGKQVLSGFNDLATLHPEIAAQWHPTKNAELVSDNVLPSYSKKIWWRGDCKHEWLMSVTDRVARRRGCSVCRGLQVQSGVNDLASTHPDLLLEWDYVKNVNVSPNKITSGSKQKIWWVGQDCNHSWLMAVQKRTQKKSQGCSVCAGKKISPDTTLKVTYPEIAKQWHPIKNTILVSSITAGSNRKVWWLGECGHEWQAPVKNRTKQQEGCPFCKNRKILLGFNDLATNHPHLVEEWDSLKNGANEPTMIVSGSKLKAHWVCDAGHEWEATPDNRTRAASGCPSCYARNFVSNPEKEITAFLKQSYKGTILTTCRNIIKKQELDIYIPDKNIAIEYNGLYWHSEKYKTRNYHYDKWLACKEKGIQLIQIWEDDYLRNPELVKRMLSHKLGLNEQNKIYARQTILKNTYSKQAEEFLKQNHIQGYASGSYYLGLYDKKDIEKLVAVLVVKKEAGTNGKTLNIIRYATSMNVIGGFTKLLKYVERTYKPERIITFSDHCVSDGGLYENNGFIADKELAPDYMYVVGNVRKHKFGYRLKRFQNDTNLKYEPGLTERELAALNGLHRVWDAGKTRWVKRIL